MNAVDEMRGCPWCGSTDITVREGSTFRWRVAECVCGATCGEIRHNTMADDQDAAEVESTARAIEAWNTRASQPKGGDGWQLVPIEPTEAMCQACMNEQDDHDDYGPREVIACDIWKAMLAVAPTGTKGESHEL